MKKIIVLLALVLCFGLSFSTYTSAKDESKAELKKKITALQKENKKLKADNATLNKKVPSVVSGKIYQNGVRSGGSNFVKMGSKSYVEIENIIPLLTSYTDQQVKFDYKGKALYLGVMPSKGVIGLTNLKPYENGNIYIDRDISINNKRYSKNLFSNSNSYKDISYKINGKYSKLRIFYGMNDWGEKEGEIKISGDGNELFYSGKIESQDDAKYVEIDVRGVKYLEIYLTEGATIGNPTLAPK